MNVTTGTIMCNARYKKINGYDCFVNMEGSFTPDTLRGDNGITVNNTEDPAYAPVSGVASTLYMDETNIKISPKSICIQNLYNAYFLTTNNIANHSSSEFTLAYWGRFSSLASGKLFIGASEYYDNIGYRYLWDNESRVIFYTNPSTGQFERISRTLSENTWYHFMICSKNNKYYIFLNGTLISSPSVSGNSYINEYIAIRGCKARAYYDDIVFVDNEALATSSFAVPTTYLIDKNYDNTKLGPNNIMYPLTAVEAQKIFEYDGEFKLY